MRTKESQTKPCVLPNSGWSVQYNPESGKIYSRPRHRGLILKWMRDGIFGTLMLKDGKVWIEAFRIAYLAMTGELREEGRPVFYKNGDYSDIRWENLEFPE